MTTVGFMVVPLLFAYLPTPAVAGAMAARLFSAQTWVSVVCGMLLLTVLRRKEAVAPDNRAQDATIFIVSGMLLALLVEFAVAPQIVARDNLRLWHTVGSSMYVLQWLCAAMVMNKLSRIRPAPP